jgi:hypothetical protein
MILGLVVAWFSRLECFCKLAHNKIHDEYGMELLESLANSDPNDKYLDVVMC